MTAMEARIISSSTEEATVATSNNKKEVNNMTPTKSRRPKTGGGSGSSELRKSSNNSAQAKAKEAKEKAAQQWQRRKNYDPLKSMSKSKLGSSANSSRDYTDESSDVESAASFSQRGDRVGAGGVPTNPRVALIRSDGGRHSLRQQHKDQEGHHGGPVTGRGAGLHGGHVDIVIGNVSRLDAVVIVVVTPAHVIVVVVAVAHFEVSAHPAPPPPVLHLRVTRAWA